MTFERLKDIFLSYVENDADTAEISYVREVLEDVCGLDKEEAAELELDWVFDED